MARLWQNGALALVLTAALASGTGGEAAAQEQQAVERLAAQVAACSMLQDPTDRLSCYDEAAGREGDPVVAEGVILDLAGSDDFDSDTFVVAAPWHIRWDSAGSIFTVELQNIAGELIGIIGNQIGAGNDRSDPQPPGEYQLAVRAIGEWQIWVMEEDD